MGGVKGIGDVDSDGQKIVEFEGGAVDEVLERAAFHELHDQEGTAILFSDVVDGADVRVVQCGGGFGFTAKTLDRGGVLGGPLREKFYGDEPVQGGAVSRLHYCH